MVENAELAARPVPAGATRCPFCHEAVAPDDPRERLSVCRRCLARHHEACWTESHRCASCGSALALVEGESRSTVETIRAVLAPVAALIGSWTVGPLGTALVAIAFAEHALVEHRARDAVGAAASPPRIPVRLTHFARAHARVRRPSRVASLARTALAGIAVAAPWVVAAGLVGLGVLGFPEVTRARALVALVAAASASAVALAAHVHLHREAVAHHDDDHLTIELVRRALSPREAATVRDRARLDWHARRLVDTALTFTAAVPVLGVFAFSHLAARVAGALALHEAHVAALDARRAATDPHAEARRADLSAAVRGRGTARGRAA